MKWFALMRCQCQCWHSQKPFISLFLYVSVLRLFQSQNVVITFEHPISFINVVLTTVKHIFGEQENWLFRFILRRLTVQFIYLYFCPLWVSHLGRISLTVKRQSGPSNTQLAFSSDKTNVLVTESISNLNRCEYKLSCR